MFPVQVLRGVACCCCKILPGLVPLLLVMQFCFEEVLGGGKTLFCYFFPGSSCPETCSTSFPVQNLTYEIILTLGQAFEVAYQLALQAQRTKQHQNLPAGPGSDVIETKSSRPVPKPRGSVRKSAVSWIHQCCSLTAPCTAHTQIHEYFMD